MRHAKESQHRLDQLGLLWGTGGFICPLEPSIPFRNPDMVIEKNVIRIFVQAVIWQASALGR